MTIPVHIEGNLTRDPELKFSKAGRPICNFGVAKNNRVRNDKGEWEDGEPDFFNCAAFGDLAEHIAESVTKGDRVQVVGNWRQRWYDKDDEKRLANDILCDEVGVALRWATVDGIERKKGAGGGPKTPPMPEESDYGNDEEPF